MFLIHSRDTLSFEKMLKLGQLLTLEYVSLQLLALHTGYTATKVLRTRFRFDKLVWSAISWIIFDYRLEHFLILEQTVILKEFLSNK